MHINVHAGHNPAGMTASGASGLIEESTENRKVKNEVIRQLRELGNTVYDCTVDNGKGQMDVLKKIVEMLMKQIWMSAFILTVRQMTCQETEEPQVQKFMYILLPAVRFCLQNVCAAKLQRWDIETVG